LLSLFAKINRSNPFNSLASQKAGRARLFAPDIPAPYDVATLGKP